MRTLSSLDELVEVVADDDHDLYIRWSKGPEVDGTTTSKDELTGVPLPGLSANPLRVERWWEDRPLRLWVARRLHDYRHLRDQRGSNVHPWLLRGREVARGPDNEPLVDIDEPLAWIDEGVLREVDRELAEHSQNWGTLDRAP